MDETAFYYTFVLKNLSTRQEDVQIGFPVDSQFARYDRQESPVISPRESREWVSQYSFMARDEKRTYHVEFVRRKPKEGPGEFSELFTWNMSFAPMETRTLVVQYRIPMTMGLTSTRKNERATYSFGAPLEQELLNFGMEEVVGYITSTGSSWAGNVESAKFTVITEPFERYLDVRGVGEEPLGEDAQQDDNAAQLRKAFPVRHPWWFRTISPDGWKAVDHGIQRTYKDYKPQDPIVLCYYMTELPRLPEEVPAFLDQFLANLPDNSAALSGRTQLNKAVKPDEDRNPAGQAAVELRRLKELLLATYGKAPQDQLVRQHVTTQIWYSPREGFTMEALSKTQKAILDQIDGRIAEAREAQPLPKN